MTNRYSYEGVSHMDQEPLDFAAALTLLRKAREEIKRLRVPSWQPCVRCGAAILNEYPATNYSKSEKPHG